MARNPIITGIPNYSSLTDYLAITAASAASGFPVENLLDERPSETWRSANPAPHKCAFHLGVDTDVLSYFRPPATIFGALPTNLGRESGLFRVIGATVAGGNPTVPTPEEIVPNGEGAGHSGTGGAANVDEGWSGSVDGNVCRLTSGQAMHLTFPTPTDSPIAGAHRQAFVIELEGQTDISGSAPTIGWCRLFEAGSETTDLGRKFLPHALVGKGKITLIFTWDAGDLGTASGADVEIWFQILNATVDVHRVAWLMEDADTYSGMGVVFDSEWQVAWPALGGSYVSPVRPEEESFPPYALHLAAAGVTYTTVQSFLVLFCDDQVPTVDVDGSGYVTTSHIPRIPDGYVEAGVAIWSLGLETPRGGSFGPALKVVDPSPTVRTAGGQLLGSSLPKRRAVYLTCNPVDADAMAAFVDRIDLLKGTTRPVLFLPNPDNAVESQLFNVYGYLRDPSDFVREKTSTPLYGKAYVFEEAR